MNFKDKKVIFALPGSSYSGNFLCSFTELIVSCINVGIKVNISQSYSSMVNFSRCKVAGADVFRGKHQEPFGGQAEYDYMMWIDSDIRFSPDHFFALLAHDLDIVSGWYCMTSGPSCAVEKMDRTFYAENGFYEFITPEKIAKREKVFEVDYNGFGWMLIKRGVFEKLPYPWFAPKLQEIETENGPVYDMCSEDVAFCMDAREAGFKIYLDPKVRVGHEKILVI